MTRPSRTPHRLAPGPRGGACARPGGAGRAQAGSQANRQGAQSLALSPKGREARRD